MDTDKKRQTTLRVSYSKLPAWHGRIYDMRQCLTLDALITRHGAPHHKVPQKGFEIWHYPLGIESGMFYSIHVSVWPDQSKEVFMYFEPASGKHSHPRRHWWQFWRKKDDTSDQYCRSA